MSAPVMTNKNTDPNIGTKMPTTSKEATRKMDESLAAEITQLTLPGISANTVPPILSVEAQEFLTRYNAEDNYGLDPNDCKVLFALPIEAVRAHIQKTGKIPTPVSVNYKRPSGKKGTLAAFVLPEFPDTLDALLDAFGEADIVEAARTTLNNAIKSTVRQALMRSAKDVSIDLATILLPFSGIQDGTGDTWSPNYTLGGRRASGLNVENMSPAEIEATIKKLEAAKAQLLEEAGAESKV